jgi:hypothetical protein
LVDNGDSGRRRDSTGAVQADESDWN